MIISVIGGSQAPIEVADLAEEVGRELAKRGVVVACGGLKGVMEAVCKGAKSEGGTTIGILPALTPAQPTSGWTYPYAPAWDTPETPLWSARAALS